MKSTPEERELWKKQRSIRRIQKLLNQIDGQLSKSHAVIVEIEKVIAQSAEALPQIHLRRDAIRRAN